MTEPTPEERTPDSQNEHSQEWQRKLARRAEMEANNPLKNAQEGPALFEPHPEDGTAKRFLKRIGRTGQLVFGALLALFIAIVTFAAG